MLKKRRVKRIIKQEARIIYDNLQKARRLGMIKSRDFDYLIDELLSAKVNSDCKLISLRVISPGC